VIDKKNGKEKHSNSNNGAIYSRGADTENTAIIINIFICIHDKW